MSIDRARKIRDLRILHILNDGYYASFLLLLPFIAKELNLNLAQIGTLGSLVNVSKIALALPAGYIAGRISGIKALVVALLLYTIGYILTSISPSYLQLIFTFLIAGIGFGIFHPVALALIAKWADVKKRGRELGAFTALGDIGNTGFTALLAFLIGILGWRLTSFVYGLAAFIVFLYFLVSIRKISNIKSKNRSFDLNPLTSLLALLRLLRNRKMLFANAANMLDMFASQPIIIFLPFLLIKKGVAQSLLGFFVAAFFVGSLVGKTVSGWFADRYRSTTVLIVSELIMAVLIIILAISTKILPIVVASVLLGIVTKGTIPVILTMISDSVQDPRLFNKAYAMNSFVAGIGSALSPFALGIISDKFGIIAAFYVCAAVATAVTIPALAYRYSKRAIS